MFYNKLRDMTWQSECDMQTPYRVMTAQIGFAHEECSSDEVEFCIVAWDAQELDKLFTVFCKENHFKKVEITGISIVRVAETMDALIEMEENL